MSVIALTSQETRLKNLIRIAQLTILIGILASMLYVYLGISTQNWYNLLVAGSLLLVSLVAFLIVKSGGEERPVIGAWHLLLSIVFAALVVSLVQANAGTEVGSAVLIVVLVIVVQALPPEKAMHGAILGVIVSLMCGVSAFYSPLHQAIDNNADLTITWISRIAMLVFLAMIMTRFRFLSLANKLLVALLGVVVLFSLTFNIVITSTTTNTVTNQIGQQLNAAADARSIIIGDYLNAQVEVLKTLALDETVRQSVTAANALKPDLNDIFQLDEQWQQAVTTGTNDSLINSRLTNSLSNNLRAFQSISPEHVEVFVTDKLGALVASTAITSDYYQADEVWWQSAYRQEDAYISLPVFDESANALSILVAVPIYDTRQGNLIGILRTTISIHGLISIIDDPIGETGEVDLFFPDHTMLDTKQLEYEEINPESLSAIENLTSQVYLRTLFEEEDRIMARTEVRSQSPASKVNELGWSVIVSQDTNEALAPVGKQLRVSSFYGTLMAGVAALLSLVLAQRISNPIINLTQTANEISSGKLEARAKVDSQDEIGQLAESFNEMTTQLRETLVGLEVRVAERTAELEKSTHQLQKRAEQFEAVAQVARVITSIQNLDILLPRITQLVSQQFGFYHVGLFLLDESRQYAVLSAANSEGGQRMLARKHRLGVGQTGIVGYVTSTGMPRIALDTGMDAVYFDNPDLPETRSEMALPLRVSKTVVGALDVQSTEPNAFSDEDVEVLTILADEISVAIENSRLFEESQRVLADAQSAFGQFTQATWQKMVAKRKVIGYELSGASLRPLDKPAQFKDLSFTVPIKLRNRTIGSINISLPDKKGLGPDEIDITQALAQRIGIAVENAALLESSQRTAAKEQVIGEITGKIGSSINLRNVLQTAVEELGRNIPGSEVMIELKSQQDKAYGSVSGEIK